MSDDPSAMITISSSDNEDVQKVQAQAQTDSSKNAESNSYGGKTEGRKIPLQRVATGKEIFYEFVEKYKSTTKDNLAEIEKISKKLWKRFNEAAEDYIRSKSFQELMSKAMDKFHLQPYSELKTVADELRNHKKSKIAPKSDNSLPSTSSTSTQNCDQEVDPKTLLHIKKLEKILTKLHYRIQKLENEEVDLNSSDEENTSYIQVARYKERFCQVFQKLCELKKKDPDAERACKKQIKFSGTQIPEVNRAIEKFYNVQREFPDYRDILTVVKKANEIKQLNLSSADINLVAQKAFQELGKTLKKYRQWDDAEIFRSYISDEEDPASKNLELEKVLEENKKKYGNRIDEVIDKYAIIQDNERLEPTEVLSNAEDEDNDDDDDEDDDDVESDCDSHSNILEIKSDIEESVNNPDRECYPGCRVVLIDVRHSPAWEQYVVREQKVESIDFETNPSEPEGCSSFQSIRKRSLESEPEEGDSSHYEDYSEEPIPSTSKQFVPITLSNFRHIKRSKIEKPDESTQNNNSNEKSVKISSPDVNNLKVDDSSSAAQKTTTCVDNLNNSDKFSSTTSSTKYSVNSDSQTEIEETQKDSKSSPVDDIIDLDKDVLQKKTLVDAKAKTPNSEQQECLNNVDLVQNHFLCPNDSLPLEVVLDVDVPTTSRSVAEKNQSITVKNNTNDEIVIIEENIKSKSPAKVTGDIIDIEEISDGPEKSKSKQVVRKNLGQPVNLSEIIRSMNFSSDTSRKSNMVASSSKQIATTRNNLNQVHQGNKMRNPFQNFRQISPNTSSMMSRTMNNFSNMSQSRSVNQFMNQRHHSNNRQFTSSMQRSVQNVQYFANNSINSMKPSQAAMQRKHVSERTVQMFDSKTNKMITRREITTVVQQSVTQFVGQNQRAVNRPMQQVRRQQVSMNRNGSSSEDIITLD